MANASSLERIIPDDLRAGEATGAETLRLHLARYEFALRNLVPGTVLDLACGVGYGTALLATSPDVSSAVGVDVSQEAVSYAVQRFGAQSISYACASALDFNPAKSFDNVVSLETIEHVDDPEKVLAHLVSLVRPGGRMIASVPVTPSVDANPHHKTNFTAAKFKQMGENNQLTYRNSLVQIQRFNPFAVLLRQERRASDLRSGIASFYWHHPSHLFLRITSIFRDGFANKYLTIAWEKPREHSEQMSPLKSSSSHHAFGN